VWIVEGSDLEVVPDALDDFISDKDRRREGLAAMHNAVPDRMNIRPVVDDAVVSAEEDSEDVFDGADVVNDFPGNFDFITIVADVGQGRTIHADAFHSASGKRLL
jgi:hypothetical protein